MWSSFLSAYKDDLQEFVSTVAGDTSAVVSDVASNYVKPLAGALVPADGHSEPSCKLLLASKLPLIIP
jgi:hypothetical protein